jgi:sugar lactone lactonase YvrE
MARKRRLYEVFDKRFKSLMIGIAHLDKLADGCIWAEGPVWFADGGLSAVERHPQQPHAALDAGDRRQRLSARNPTTATATPATARAG